MPWGTTLLPAHPQSRRQDRHHPAHRRQAAHYAEWVASQRELRRLIAEMENISRQAAGLIPSKPPETGKTPGDQPA
jgi:anti-sigma factor RsiW